MKILALAVLALSIPCRAALDQATQWDVRTGGSDTNGGGFVPGVSIPGHDYSQQNSPQVTYTDLAIGVTTTQVTSAAFPFATCTAGVGYCGNLIHITGGSGCTTGWYEIVSTSTITATLDRSAGTAASVCTGKLGGSMQTLQAADTAAAAENTVWIKSATYTLTSGYTMTKSIIWEGYTSTHGDIVQSCAVASCPTFTTSTSSLGGLFDAGSANGAFVWQNLNVIDTTATNNAWNMGASGTKSIVVNNCVVNGFSIGLNVASGSTDYVYVNASKLSNNGNSAINTYTSLAQLSVTNSLFDTNGIDINEGNTAPVAASYNIFANSTSSVFNSVVVGVYAVFDHNVWFNCGGNCIDFTMNAGGQVTSYVQLTNNIFWLSAAGGPEHQPVNYNAMTTGMYNNAFGGLTNPVQSPYISPTNITLTVCPFQSCTGTLNFALNSTAGGGALLKGHGFPASFGASTTTTSDVGAAQSTGSVTTSSGNYGVSN